MTPYDTPTITHNPDGTVVLTLPDPPARDYPVAVELLHQWVATINENVALRAEIDQLRAELADSVLAILNGQEPT